MNDRISAARLLGAASFALVALAPMIASAESFADSPPWQAPTSSSASSTASTSSSDAPSTTSAEPSDPHVRHWDLMVGIGIGSGGGIGYNFGGNVGVRPAEWLGLGMEVRNHSLDQSGDGCHYDGKCVTSFTAAGPYVQLDAMPTSVFDPWFRASLGYASVHATGYYEPNTSGEKLTYAATLGFDVRLEMVAFGLDLEFRHFGSPSTELGMGTLGAHLGATF